MIKCPSCNHENVDGTTFCEMCGEELQAATPPSADADTAVPTAGGDIKCPACENLNPPDNVVCEVCGTELRPAGAPPVTVSPDTTPSTTSDATSTAASDAADAAATAGTVTDAAIITDVTPPAPPDTTPTTMDDAPTVASTDTESTPEPAVALKPGKVKLVVEQGMNVGKQFILGDAEMQVGREDEEDDIYPDIDLSDQDEGYVHRRHATLKFENDVLTVTHLGGANKTRINNKPIPDNESQPVKLGDKVAFGKVVMRVLPA